LLINLYHINSETCPIRDHIKQLPTNIFNNKALFFITFSAVIIFVIRYKVRLG
jgi:hypothetical protein